MFVQQNANMGRIFGKQAKVSTPASDIIMPDLALIWELICENPSLKPNLTPRFYAHRALTKPWDGSVSWGGYYSTLVLFVSHRGCVRPD